MRLEDSLLIDCSPPDLFAMTRDVERHAEWLPDYKESRVIKKEGPSCFVQRAAIMHGKLRRWISEVWFDEGRCIHFRQVEGPLAGMHVQWVHEPALRGTRLRIIHDVHVTPRWKGWWFERWVAKPAIEKTARKVLHAIKSAAEKRARS
jgi:ribosome-associated toxin RatA of RatAB toxin-antitoxin module